MDYGKNSDIFNNAVNVLYISAYCVLVPTNSALFHASIREKCELEELEEKRL